MTKTLQLVEQHIICRDDPRFATLDQACFHAKNIYNAANYELRQTYVTEERRISYDEQEKHFKKKDLLPDQQLPLKVVQQVLIGLHHDWDSFAAALVAYQTNPEKFTTRPRLPHYKPKTNGRCTIVFTIQAISKDKLKKGEIVLSGLKVGVKTQQQVLDQVRVVPHKTHYALEVVYTKRIEPDKHLHPEWIAAGDLGIDTLLALASNKPGFVPLLVNGRPLKAINQRYNKHRSDLQSRLPVQQFNSRQLDVITDKRNWRIKTELHRCSRLILKTLLEAQIGTLVIGKNVGWKQEVNLGKRTNQNFVGLPHAQFIQMLTYKAQLVWIKVIVSEESYTSKCSFLDLEAIGKHEQYAGRRVQRGLFRASDGRCVQADVNGAYNILRKVVPNAFADGIEAAVVQPVRVYPCAN